MAEYQIAENMLVRHATPADIPSIAEITHDAFLRYARDLGLPDRVSALKETEQDIATDMQTKKVLVGLLDDEPVGSIRYHMLPNNIAYISRFGVKSSAQNCGMGRILIQKVHEECMEAGVDAIILHTSSKMLPLMRFYYGMGYYVQETRTDRGYIRALLCHEVCAGAGFDLRSVYEE